MPAENAAAESLLRGFDARVKLVAALLLIVGVLLTPDQAYPAYPLTWTLIASLGALGGIGAFGLARRSAVALPFALAGITLLFSTPGTPLVSLGGLSISSAGVERFAGVVLKTLLSAQISVVLMLTTPAAEVLWALGALRVPPPLVQIAAMLHRYLFTLKDEAACLRAARASRSATLPGRRSGGSLLWRAQTAGSMIGGLFLRSLERSERVHTAMAARGFEGQVHAAPPAPLQRSAVLLGLLPPLVLLLIHLMARAWWTP